MQGFLRLFISLVLLHYASALRAQSVAHRADKYYARAHESYQSGQEEKAIAWMQQAIEAHPEMRAAYADLGFWLYKNRRYAEALKVYERGTVAVRNGAAQFALAMTKCALALYDAGTAATLIQKFGNNQGEWKQLSAQRNFIQQHYKPYTQDSLHRLSLRINTPNAESFAFLSADGQRLWYTTGVKGLNEAIFQAQWDSCTNDWFSGKPLPYPINTPLHNAAATTSADAHYLFFMRCDYKSDNGWDNGACDLYMAYTADSVWSTPQSFGGTINGTGYEGTACLSPDNKALYFSSDKPGGRGGRDIWVSFFEEGKWQGPINLGPSINTEGDESAPFIAPDNQTLFFVSDGRPGLGGMDIYRARKQNDTVFSTAENLGYPFNSSADEVSMTVASDAVKAFICSDRDGKMGMYDVYETRLPKRFQPDAVTYIKGYTFDSLTTERLTLTTVQLMNFRTGKTEYRFVSNRGDGSFMMALPLHEKFVVITDKIGYAERTDTILLQEQYWAAPFPLNIGLLPDNYVPPTFEKLAGVFYFEKNAIQVADSVKSLLAQLTEDYKRDERAKIVVNSFTDNSGTPMLNEQISTQRAEAIRDWILRHGWAEERISAIGWGESSPVATNDTEEGKNLNRRVEVVIQTVH